jgi:hypothetical protein
MTVPQPAAPDDQAVRHELDDDHPGSVERIRAEVEAVRATVVSVRVELAHSEEGSDSPEGRFVAAAVRLIELAADDAAAVNAMNERTRARAERVGGDGHTWAMHRPEWAAARAAALAWREVDRD